MFRAVFVANTIHQEGAGLFFRLNAYFISSLTVLLYVFGDSIPFLWDTRPRHSAFGSQRFDGTQCFHLQESSALFPNHRLGFRHKLKNKHINILKYHERFRNSLEISRVFLSLAIANSGLISARYQQQAYYLAGKHFYRHGFVHVCRCSTKP
jgi:hypothetical protein